MYPKIYRENLKVSLVTDVFFYAMDSCNFAQAPSVSVLHLINLFFKQLSHMASETNLKYVNLNQRRQIATYWNAAVSRPIYEFLLKKSEFNSDKKNKNLCFDVLI